MSDSPPNLHPLHDCAPPANDVSAAVHRGLAATPKELPCMLLYDEAGSQLFDRICTLPTYYPTRTEKAIMQASAAEMAEWIGPDALVLEYGSGSSEKTPLLLEALQQPAGYIPLDIAREHVQTAARALAERYPNLPVAPVCADYTQDFTLPPLQGRRRLLYFPGSTLGNFDRAAARDFLAGARARAGADGAMLLGVDLAKDPTILKRAYDDPEGVTAAFNRNMLHHINRVLEADFDPERFAHEARVDSDGTRVSMHLVSQGAQTVHVEGRAYRFEDGESIHTENSHKFMQEEFRALAREAGWDLSTVWRDPDQLFSAQLLEPAFLGRNAGL